MLLVTVLETIAIVTTVGWVSLSVVWVVVLGAGITVGGVSLAGPMVVVVVVTVLVRVVWVASLRHFEGLRGVWVSLNLELLCFVVSCWRVEL